MRSYTSLFGHILGSNPDICGYYEMHMGYYSWKSLIRQKLLYFDQETPKPGFKYMFDKILHNEHSVSPDILNRKNAKVIFCLRQPGDSIPSIQKLYSRIDPGHPFNSESFASEYYMQRLTVLGSIANTLERGYFYLDADALKFESTRCLESLSDWLGLATRLSPHYELQKNTSAVRYGDSSGKLNAGRISTDTATYTGVKLDAQLQGMAAAVYDRVRLQLINSSSHHCITKGATA